MRVVLVGRPGSGKTTLGNLLRAQGIEVTEVGLKAGGIPSRPLSAKAQVVLLARQGEDLTDLQFSAGRAILLPLHHTRDAATWEGWRDEVVRWLRSSSVPQAERSSPSRGPSSNPLASSSFATSSLVT